MTSRRHKKEGAPFDAEGLERAALSYVGRYATTRARLAAYLGRKLRERGWTGSGRPSIDRLVERMAALGYVDDAAFASARTASLLRRGYGERRIAAALRAAGIEEEDAAAAGGQARDQAFDAAIRFARKKRIGPFAASMPDRAAREKAFAAMIRAGHSVNIARQVLDLAADEFPECDSL